MFPIHVLLKIKEAKTGFLETRISLNSREVALSLYMGQMNTWTIFLRLLILLFLYALILVLPYLFVGKCSCI